MLKRYTIPFLLLFTTFFSLRCEEHITENDIAHSLGVSLEETYVGSSISDDLRSERFVQEKISSHSATMIGLKYSFRFLKPTVRYWCRDGYQGVGVGVMWFGNTYGRYKTNAQKYIGNPYLLYVFQGAPIVKFNEKLHLGYEWQFGASFGWKPYSNLNENFNLTVGSKVNAYLNVGIILGWRIQRHITVTGGLVLTHFSNGNTSWPNPGVNMGGIRIGAIYDFGDSTHIPETEEESALETRKKIEYNIAFWGSLRKRVYRGGEKPVLLNGHFAVAGLYFSPLWKLGKHWGVGGSLDIEWDESSNLKKYYYSGETSEDILFQRPPVYSQISVGLSAHGELRMPIFSLNAGIGYNLISPPENRGSYLNLTLKTYVLRCLYLNVGYQLRNFYQQSSLMLGLGVSI